MILRTFLAALALASMTFCANAQTGSVKTPSQLSSEINSTYPDQSAGDITPLDLRQVSLDQVASVPFLNFANAFLQPQTMNFGLTVGGTFTATGLVTNADLANPSTSVNGITCTLGATCTITATATSALTFGTHLTGTSYNGSSPVTLGTDATNANTVSTIVARDGSGNFSAGTITASLTGHASLDLALSALGSNVQTALGNAANASGGFVTSPVPYANIATGVSDTVLGYWGSTVASATAVGNCSSALTYNTSTHLFGCNSLAGSGNVSNSGTPVANQVAQWTGATTIQGVNLASLLTAGSGITITGTTSPTISLSLTNRTVHAAPTGTTQASSSTQLMFGFGNVCTITPLYSTRVRFTVQGTYISGSAELRNLRFGTGTAPVSGATASTSGTALWATPFTVAAQATALPFNYFGIATGLTPGTAYWFDMSGAGTSTGGNDIAQTPVCDLEEY